MSDIANLLEAVFCVIVHSYVQMMRLLYWTNSSNACPVAVLFGLWQNARKLEWYRPLLGNYFFVLETLANIDRNDIYYQMFHAFGNGFLVLFDFDDLCWECLFWFQHLQFKLFMKFHNQISIGKNNCCLISKMIAKYFGWISSSSFQSWFDSWHDEHSRDFAFKSESWRFNRIRARCHLWSSQARPGTATPGIRTHSVSLLFMPRRLKVKC